MQTTNHGLEGLLSVQQLSDYLDVPVQTLCNWRTTSQGPKAVKLGRHLRYTVSSVNDWLEGQAN